MSVFLEAVGTKRPAGSISESSFVASLAKRLPITMIDGAGNLHVDLRDLASPRSRTIFTSHTDSVHSLEGANRLSVDGRHVRACGDVLGADDGAGVAIMCHMIENKVPGLYCFFRSEETGGLGSKWLASEMPDLLIQFDRAIAFDRAGYYDVITHQAGVRCCSDEFADALAQQLSFEESGLMFMPSDGGVYTDTAEFTGLIPCCTNISVGYFLQHTTNEHQDVEFLRSLAEVLCLVNWEALPVKRDPAEKEDLWAGWAQYGVTSKIGLSLVEEPKDLGAEEKKLMQALTSALVEDNLAPVLQQVRELLNDYGNVYKSSALKDNFLDDYITALLGGFTAYDVALDIQEILING